MSSTILGISNCVDKLAPYPTCSTQPRKDSICLDREVIGKENPSEKEKKKKLEGMEEITPLKII